MFRIAEAARLVGCHPNTLKLLEKRGLIQGVKRNWAGHRIFTDEQIEKIRQDLFPVSNDDHSQQS